VHSGLPKVKVGTRDLCLLLRAPYACYTCCFVYLDSSSTEDQQLRSRRIPPPTSPLSKVVSTPVAAARKSWGKYNIDSSQHAGIPQATLLKLYQEFFALKHSSLISYAAGIMREYVRSSASVSARQGSNQEMMDSAALE
jgi:hypothetical protein